MKPRCHKSVSQTQLLNKDAEREEKKNRFHGVYCGSTFSRNMHAKIDPILIIRFCTLKKRNTISLRSSLQI